MKPTDFPIFLAGWLLVMLGAGKLFGFWAAVLASGIVLIVLAKTQSPEK